MIVRSMIAGAAVIALMAGATPTAFAAETKAAPKVTRKELTDRAGNKLSLDLDEAGKKVVAKTATDREGKPLEIVEIKMKDTRVCIPRAAGAKNAKRLCQPLAYVSDEAEVKMGTATCTCRVYYGVLLCYGDTCQ